ncbi:unnamed protein product, partial [Prorocentrum cordatum]
SPPPSPLPFPPLTPPLPCCRCVDFVPLRGGAMGRGCPWLLAVVLIATASHAGVGRCLDEDERILGSPFVSTIVVEANAWDSSMIAASIGRILIEELLGYRVVIAASLLLLTFLVVAARCDIVQRRGA